jgi:hypothetical protein
MAKTATYSLISAYTHTGASTTEITMSSIPQTFTDLIIQASVLYSADNGNYIGFRINGSTSSIYSSTPMVGNGSSTNSYRATGDSKIAFYGSSTSTYTTVTIHLNDYASAAINKSPLIRSSTVSSDNVEARAGLWQSTAAVSSFSLWFPNASIAAGTNIKVYGIQAGNA